ncbi:MAG: PEP-CTERM sorting domain-containing protein [Sedimentisphaerales bacterium]|nr:PEP-CTERM sorting domain-containing protein [Sedimentisphaerales bacterium]
MKKYLVLTLLFVATGMVSAGIITSIERRNPDSNSGDTEPLLSGSPIAAGMPIFVDRTHVYGAVPADILGADYVIVANDDKDNAAYELDVTLSAPGILGIIVDNRVGHGSDPGTSDLTPDFAAAGMQWVIDMGFVDSGLDVEIDESGDGDIDNWSSVFIKEVAAGTYTLYQQNDATNAGGRNMYSVGAIPEPMTLTLLGLGGLALVRRRR